MNLNTFILNYIDQSTRVARDFTGPRGWVFILNTILRDMESRGFTLDQKKEIGVEVSNSYWITPPVDMRRPIKIFNPQSVAGTSDPNGEEFAAPFNIVNGKIKLFYPYGKNLTPDAFTLSAWGINGVSITSATIVDNQYNDYLLVVTNGDLTGKTIMISDCQASVGGTSVLTFLQNDGNAASTSTSGYLTNQYLMLRYMARFTGLVGVNDVIPLSEMYFNALVAGTYREATGITDPKYKQIAANYLDALDVLGLSEFTPTEDQARSKPRPMPGYNVCGDRGNWPDPDRYDSGSSSWRNS